MHKVSKALIGLLSGSFFLLYGCRTAAPTESEGEGFLKRQIADGSATALSKVLERTGAKVSKTREGRFLGKVTESQAKRRGGEQALKRNKTPWIDWGAYYGSRDVKDEGKDQRGFANIVSGATSGHYGSLLDLEVQRVELLKFNMYDTNGEYDDYRNGDVTKKIFPSLQGLDCGEENDYGNKKWWFRTTDGRCNDMQNPKMGMANLAFPRNVDFMATFPDIERGNGPTIKNGIKVHYALNDPDPKKVSDILLKRDGANHGQYIGAPFFNLLAAFWIQFQTHDWFDHSKDGINKPGSKMPIYNDGSLMADRSIENPNHDKTPGAKPPKTFQNQVTPWWDCSQLYGWNPDSSMRVRDPNDRAKLRILANGQLPLFVDTDPVQPRYVGQEVAAFPTNWSLGVAMFHTIFVKEHNTFVDKLRVYIRTHRDEKIGEGAKITYGQLTDDDIFNLARLVVVAEVAKIHTIEWTTQLLFNRPLHDAMNANWHGLFRSNWGKAVTKFLGKSLLASESEKGQDAWAALAAAPGIVGNPGGPVQFGSPYGLPEEFTTVYRLHPMLPDFLQVRNDLNRPYHIEKVIKTINTIQQKSPIAMKEFGDMARVILSMGNQQLGQLVLKNYPEFIRNLEMTQHKEIGLGPIDLAALDVLRDRERGVPRYNEFRRQIGLAEVRYFSDFVNKENIEGAVACVVKSASGCSDLKKAVKGIWDTDHDVTDLFKELVSRKDSCGGNNVAGCKAEWDAFEYQMDVVEDLADVYDHDLEKIDAIPGYLAEYSRPHGFAISETQFQIFILNASRRLFSDRFFTKDFRPGVYTGFGHSWVVNNGPNKGDSDMSPLKALLIRNFPELKATLAGVENVFDIWNRKRSDYYSLKWTPRDAKDDGFNTKKLSELHEKAND